MSESFRKAQSAVMVLSYIYTCTYIPIDVSTFSSSSSQGYRTRVSESFRKAQSAVLSYMHTYTHIHMYVSTFPFLSQAYRTRVSESFRKAETAVMVASDVAARGVDYPGVSLVIQMGAPENREQYVHRTVRR